MAKGAYIGVDGKARKVKKIYIGVNNVAKKVKKAYIGVDGKARLCYSGVGVISYYGEITSLAATMQNPTTASAVNYALFTSGTSVTAYNKSLSRSTPTAISPYQTYCGGAAVGDYAVFAGGCTNGNSAGTSKVSTVTAYSSSLVKSNPTALSVARYNVAGNTINGNAIFAGGSTGSGVSYYNATVDSYNTSLTRSVRTSLTTKGDSLMTARVGGSYVLFAGAMVYSDEYGTYMPTTTMDVFNASLTKSTATFQGINRYMKATSVGSYAIFASTSTYAFDTSLTRIGATSLQNSGSSRYYPTAGTCEDYAIFVGGDGDGYGTSDADVYNASLTKSVLSGVKKRARESGACAVGDNIIVAGGRMNVYDSNTDSYTLGNVNYAQAFVVK